MRPVYRWLRNYHAGKPYRVSFRRLWRNVLQHQSRGRFERAYRLAAMLARRAVRMGDQQTAMAMERLITDMAPRVKDAHGSLVDSLVRAARKAVAADAWQEALACTEAIVALQPEEVTVRGRALRNRATALSVLGRFESAVRAYDALMNDVDVWDSMSPEYRAGFHLSRTAAAWYLGPVSMDAIQSAPPHISKAPATWMNYWWVMGHIAWRDFPKRLPYIRQASLRTFSLDWRFELDRALWGLDLLAGDNKASRLQHERRVKAALEESVTIHNIGRSGWLDLYADWLMFHWTRNSITASQLIAEHALWCETHGYDGWAQYWRAHESNMALLLPRRQPIQSD